MIDNTAALTDHGNRQSRKTLIGIATAAVEAVHPSRTVPAALNREGDSLRVAGRVYNLDDIENVYIIGAGKGSIEVVDELLEIIGDVVTDGVVAEKREQVHKTEGMDVYETGHPLPDAGSLAAGEATIELTERAGEDDLVFVCINGGASAQCVAPVDGVSLDDLRATTEVLLHAGLPIEEVNAVRKHLSKIKGGRLATRVTPASLVTLVVIDEVAGEPWGPTVGDKTTFADAARVLERHSLDEDVPKTVRDHLDRGCQSPELETPSPSDLTSLDALTVVLADPVDACEAATARARQCGYDSEILSTSIEGESREVATVFSGIVDEIQTHGRPFEPPFVLVSGGETTVTVSDGAGRGGPNQEFALAFALKIEANSNLTALALGTDGTDGPTDIAGALVDGSTISRIREADVDPWTHLEAHNTSDPLELVDDAIYTGSTGTNVMDLRLMLIDSQTE